MKKLTFVLICSLSVFMQNTIAQTESNSLPTDESHLVTQTFKVWGNCESCKARIEKSISVKGVDAANWSPETKLIIVSYNPEIISIEQINQRIAAAGHDTETIYSDNKRYEKLPACCQYERRPQ